MSMAIFPDGDLGDATAAAYHEAMGLPKPEGVHDLKKNMAQSMDDWLKTN
jgi:hypothetical protein